MSGTEDLLRKLVKYVFLDVVKFSKRSAEAQSEIVKALSNLTKNILQKYHLFDVQESILLPTGDGLCIAITDLEQPYDIHIRVAIEILKAVFHHNQQAKNRTRQFEVRIGINQNTDIIVEDINARQNVAGAGINMASRIMDKADGGQILVSQTVYEELNQSELYEGKFIQYSAIGKYGITFKAFQFVGEFDGNNTEPPAEFKPDDPIRKLTEIQAYYLGHAIKLRDFIIENKDLKPALIILIWFLANDSFNETQSSTLSPHSPEIYGGGEYDLREVLEYYDSIFHFLKYDYYFNYLIKIKLQPIKMYFGIEDSFSGSYLLVNEAGEMKLKSDFPNIWNRLMVDQ